MIFKLHGKCTFVHGRNAQRLPEGSLFEDPSNDQ